MIRNKSDYNENRLYSMQDLPSEIIKNIFIGLPFTQLLQCIEVCKDWKSLIQTDSFISYYFYFRFWNFPEKKGITLSRNLMDVSQFLYNSFYYGQKNNIPLAAYGASSTAIPAYHHALSIINGQNCYWLSRGTPFPEESYLILGLGVYDIAVISSFEVKFMSDREYIFSSESVSLSILDGDVTIYSFKVRLSHSTAFQRITLKKPLFLTKSHRIKISFIGQRSRLNYPYFGEGLLYYTGAKIMANGISGKNFPFKLEDNEFIKLTSDEINYSESVYCNVMEKLKQAAYDCIENDHLISCMTDEEIQNFESTLSNLALWRDNFYDKEIFENVAERIDESDSEFEDLD